MREDPLADLGARALTEPSFADLMKLSGRAGLLSRPPRAINARQRGDYRAHFKARGMEYGESRPYQQGDDVRALDWRLTARLGKPHTKLFQEERERPVHLVLDLGSSMAFATRGVFKCVQAARAAALLAWKAVEDGDRLGGMIFTDRDCYEAIPARGSLAAARFFKAIVSVSSSPTNSSANDRRSTGMTAATPMARVRRLIKPGSLLFLITDGRMLGSKEFSEISVISRNNEIGILLIYDAFEANLPILNQPLTVKSKDGEFNLPSADDEIRRRYAARFRAREDEIHQFCKNQRLMFGTLATTGDPFISVQRLLGGR